jgi:hypothetical protein
MPNWHLVINLPNQLAFAVSHHAPTGVIGVVMRAPGIIEVRGNDRDWVLEQAAIFLGRIAGKQSITVLGVLNREGERGHVAYDFSVVADVPSVVVTRPNQKPLTVILKAPRRG